MTARSTVPSGHPPDGRQPPPAGPVTIRPPGLTDVPGLFDLLCASDLHEVGEVDVEEGDVVEMLTRPRLDLARDAWLAQLDGRPVGLASVWDKDGTARLEADVCVAPDRPESLVHRLLDLVEAGAAEHRRRTGRDSVTVALQQVTGGRSVAPLLPGRGYAPVRRWTRLVRELAADQPPAHPPPGVRVRAVAGEADQCAAYRIMTDSFAEHYAFVAEEYEQWLDRQLSRSGADGSLWWLADVDRVPVGALIGRNFTEMGFVQGLGTLAGFRGRGVGRCLLQTAFAEFARRGHASVGLGVDTANRTGALALYESVGMRPVFQVDTWERRV